MSRYERRRNDGPIRGMAFGIPFGIVIWLITIWMVARP